MQWSEKDGKEYSLLTTTKMKSRNKKKKKLRLIVFDQLYVGLSLIRLRWISEEWLNPGVPQNLYSVCATKRKKPKFLKYKKRKI